MSGILIYWTLNTIVALFTGTLCQFPHNNLLELVELEANIEYKNALLTGTLCEHPHNNLLELVELEANIEYKNALLTGTLCEHPHNNLLEVLERRSKYRIQKCSPYRNSV